jgi:nitrite reductase/ring-hydroxylating ferredoxin subunit
MSDAPQSSGPDLTQGIALAAVVEGVMLLATSETSRFWSRRRGADIFAIGAICAHYSGPLAEGLLVDDTVRCPLHHACFSLSTGEALRGPALSPVACWQVEQSGETIFVREKVKREHPRQRPLDSNLPSSVVIVGGGAAGHAAAEMLRKEGFDGSITMLSADDALPKPVSLEQRRKIGFPYARRIITGRTGSTSGCVRASPRSIPLSARCGTRKAAVSHSTRCFSLPARIRYGWISQGPMCRRSTTCAPSMTVAR